MAVLLAADNRTNPQAQGIDWPATGPQPLASAAGDTVADLMAVEATPNGNPEGWIDPATTPASTAAAGSIELSAKIVDRMMRANRFVGDSEGPHEDDRRELLDFPSTIEIGSGRCSKCRRHRARLFVPPVAKDEQNVASDLRDAVCGGCLTEQATRNRDRGRAKVRVDAASGDERWDALPVLVKRNAEASLDIFDRGLEMAAVRKKYALRGRTLQQSSEYKEVRDIRMAYEDALFVLLHGRRGWSAERIHQELSPQGSVPSVRTIRTMLNGDVRAPVAFNARWEGTPPMSDAAAERLIAYLLDDLGLSPSGKNAISQPS